VPENERRVIGEYLLKNIGQLVWGTMDGGTMLPSNAILVDRKRCRYAASAIVYEGTTLDFLPDTDWLSKKPRWLRLDSSLSSKV
jgi:hypothetical protein